MPAQFPSWLRKRIPSAGSIQSTRAILESLGLNTVCDSAMCPNLGECFARHTATFMIMGEKCTRSCPFCSVTGGRPGPLDPDEPQRVAEATQRLELRHVVVTSVTRDDLPHGGADHFVATIRAIRDLLPGATIEVLTPDFQGDSSAIRLVVEAKPDIYNHNVETVARLTPSVRRVARYEVSLQVLQRVKDFDDRIYTKSGLMVGLGETFDEVIQTMNDLRDVDCNILTIGQYLQPSSRHLPVQEFVPPEVFDAYYRAGIDMGFTYVAAGPFVRSSFHADEFSNQFLSSEPHKTT